MLNRDSMVHAVLRSASSPAFPLYISAFVTGASGARHKLSPVWFSTSQYSWAIARINLPAYYTISIKFARAVCPKYLQILGMEWRSCYFLSRASSISRNSRKSLSIVESW